MVFFLQYNINTNFKDISTNFEGLLKIYVNWLKNGNDVIYNSINYRKCCMENPFWIKLIDVQLNQRQINDETKCSKDIILLKSNFTINLPVNWKIIFIPND